MSFEGKTDSRRRRRTARGLLMAGTATAAMLVVQQAHADDDWGRRDKWVPHMQLELKPGTDREIGQFDLWVPVWQNESTLAFVNPRVQADLDENYEANIGIGVRTQLNDEWILGGYAYFDYRVTENDNSFIQGVVGAELLSDDFGFRVNGYLPEDDEKLVAGVGEFDIGTVTVRHGVERALPGFDAEVEYGFNPFEEMDAELRFFAGGYYFGAEDYDTHAGPRLRAEFRLFDLDPLPNGSRVVLGAEYQWDDPRGHQAFGLLQVRVPIQGLWGAPEREKKTGLDRRMEESVRRDVDIVVDERLGDPLPARFSDGTLISDVIFLNEGGAGDGTSVEQAVDIDDYFAGGSMAGAPMENALHVVVGNDGELQSVGSALLDGQVFIGGGTSIAVQGLENLFVSFDAPGSRPTLHNEGDGTASIFTLADRNQIIGMDFRLTQADTAMAGEHIGIFGAGGNDDILLQDLTFVNDGTLPMGPGTFFHNQVGGEAIHIAAGGTGVSIVDVSATDMLGESIDLRGVDGATLSGITSLRAGRAGVLFADGTMNVTFSDFSVLDSGNIGIAVFNGSNIAITSGTVDGSGQVLAGSGQGINIGTSSDIVISGVTITDSTQNGILAASSTNVKIEDSMIDGAGNGIQFSLSDGSITGVDIMNATTNGIMLRDNGPGLTNVAINDVTIDAIPTMGINFIGGGTVTVTGAGNTIDAATVCTINGGTTVVGTVEVNGNPEPTTSCP